VIVLFAVEDLGRHEGNRTKLGFGKEALGEHSREPEVNNARINILSIVIQI
jgi:hypothetical protein